MHAQCTVMAVLPESEAKNIIPISLSLPGQRDFNTYDFNLKPQDQWRQYLEPSPKTIGSFMTRKLRWNLFSFLALHRLTVASSSQVARYCVYGWSMDEMQSVICQTMCAELV